MRYGLIAVLAITIPLAIGVAPGTACAQDRQSSTAVAQDDALTEAYSLGMAELRAERYEDALPYFQRALAIARETFGPDDQRIAVELNNLGEVYRLLGDYDEAERLLDEALRLDELADLPNSGAMATSLNNLALVALARGDSAKALDLYRQSHQLLEESFGPNHPDVAKSLNNMAMLHLERQEPAKAAPLVERSLMILQASLGTQHPVTMTIQGNVDTVRAALAAEDQAEMVAVAVNSEEVNSENAKPEEVKPEEVTPKEVKSSGVQAKPQMKAAAGGGEQVLAKRQGYAIHLASVRSEQTAREEWRRYQSSFPELGQLMQNEPEMVEIDGKGVFFRVSGGAFDNRDAALKFCELFKEKGQYCNVLARP